MTKDSSEQPKQKRKFRFRFSLFSLTISMPAVCLALAFYIHEIRPLQEQWAAAHALTAQGAVIDETLPPRLPSVIRYWLPVGEDRDIKTVSTGRDSTSSADLDEIVMLLRKLPHLQNLYLAGALEGKHIEPISKLHSVQDLCLHGKQINWNETYSETNIELLAQMPNLKKIDLFCPGLLWRTMNPFTKRPDVKVEMWSMPFPLKAPSESKLLSKLIRQTDLSIDAVRLYQPTAEEVFETIELLPKLRCLIVDNGENLPNDFVEKTAARLLQQPSLERPLRIYLPRDGKFGSRALKQTGQRFAAVTQGITLECQESPLATSERIPGTSGGGTAVTLTMQKQPRQRIVEFRFEIRNASYDPDLLLGIEDVSHVRLCPVVDFPYESACQILQNLNAVKTLELVIKNNQVKIDKDIINTWQSLEKVTLHSERAIELPDLSFLYGLKNLHTIESIREWNSGDENWFKIADASFLEEIPNLKTIWMIDKSKHNPQGKNRISYFQRQLEKQRSSKK